MAQRSTCGRRGRCRSSQALRRLPRARASPPSDDTPGVVRSRPGPVVQRAYAAFHFGPGAAARARGAAVSGTPVTTITCSARASASTIPLPGRAWRPSAGGLRPRERRPSDATRRIGIPWREAPWHRVEEERVVPRHAEIHGFREAPRRAGRRLPASAGARSRARRRVESPCARRVAEPGSRGSRPGSATDGGPARPRSEDGPKGPHRARFPEAPPEPREAGVASRNDSRDSMKLRRLRSRRPRAPRSRASPGEDPAPLRREVGHGRASGATHSRDRSVMRPGLDAVAMSRSGKRIPRSSPRSTGTRRSRTRPEGRGSRTVGRSGRRCPSDGRPRTPLAVEPRPPPTARRRR